MGLAHLGASVVLLCRDEARGSEALEELKRETWNEALELIRLDVSDLGDVRPEPEGAAGAAPVHRKGRLR